MKKVAKVSSLVLIMIILFSLTLSMSVFAELTPGTVTNANAALSNDAQNGINTVGGMFLRYARLAGMCVAVIILAIYGIQWFLASPQQKAILKEKAWGYVIGAVLVFGGATLIGWMADTVITVFG